MKINYNIYDKLSFGFDQSKSYNYSISYFASCKL